MISTKIIDRYGNELWHLANGMLHREDGPAVTHLSGAKKWLINGKYHREDGPAVIWNDGDNWWYLDDISYHFDFYCYKLKSHYGKSDEDIVLLKMQYDTN